MIGRNTIRKDNHLNRLVLNPDFQPFQIKPFNSTTLREAFTLQTGQIPGFDTLIWESEDPNAPKKKVSSILILFCFPLESRMLIFHYGFNL